MNRRAFLKHAAVMGGGVALTPSGLLELPGAAPPVAWAQGDARYAGAVDGAVGRADEVALENLATRFFQQKSW